MTTNTCCQGLEQLLDFEFFKSLGDPARINILTRLAESTDKQTVTEIAQCCPQSISVVSRHLKILKDGGVLESTKDGKEVMYQIKTKEVTSRLRALADALELCCPDHISIKG